MRAAAALPSALRNGMNGALQDRAEGTGFAVMTEWQYQIRINLCDEYAQVARSNPEDPRLEPLPGILARRQAKLTNQYAAFANYCAEAEKNGVEHYPLYKWTKATIDDPAKKAKYALSFTIYVNGEEVYAKDVADALEVELQPLVGRGMVTKLAKHDTNPANSPQPPAHLR